MLDTAPVVDGGSDVGRGDEEEVTERPRRVRGEEPVEISQRVEFRGPYPSMLASAITTAGRAGARALTRTVPGWDHRPNMADPTTRWSWPLGS